jgi:hypothetical protein
MQVTGYKYEHQNIYYFVYITTATYWEFGFVPKIIFMEKQNELVKKI